MRVGQVEKASARCAPTGHVIDCWCWGEDLHVCRCDQIIATSHNLHLAVPAVGATEGSVAVVAQMFEPCVDHNTPARCQIPPFAYVEDTCAHACLCGAGMLCCRSLQKD
jgi:hypothetical protein